jgi:hypothetical protein
MNDDGSSVTVKRLNIAGNPGTKRCDASIVVNKKGWTLEIKD